MPQPLFRRLTLITLFTLAPAARLAAQADTTPWAVPRQRPFRAVSQGLLLNLVVNRVDAWALGASWAKIRPHYWSENLKFGWEWDEDAFSTNLFAHPYHGGLYFNTGRANGLDFWESAPLAFFGSYTWEYFGETHRPSLNDFLMTSVGGIGLGEMFHRLAATIRDNRKTGGARTRRELAALPLDPMGTFNRLLRGEWRRVGPNPPEHDPGPYLVRVHAGARFAVGGPTTDRVNTYPAMLVDLRYGDPVLHPYDGPYDVFAVRAMISGGGGLNALRGSGRLFGADLNRMIRRNRHIFMINQRFDFVSNPAHKVGGQSVEAGLHSRWELGRGWGLRTQWFGTLVLLGAIDAPGAGVGVRTYDFGPGAGERTEIGLENRGRTLATIFSQSVFLHTVSGASADHYILFGGFEATVPVPLVRGLGVGIHATHFARRSVYSDRPDETKDYPELRLVLNWTAAAFPRSMR